jgi:FMN phosphatase YigB (HAD superfamily)
MAGMSKQIIAVDIDDVLAANAAGFVRFSNETWGTNLTADDYDEHWPEVWKVDLAESEQRAEMYHQSGTIGRYDHYPEALSVLQRLATRYTLMVATSRRRVVQPETEAWIDMYVPGLFKEICFVGIYDQGVTDGTRWQKTKLDLLQQKGATYLIDDQLKHCQAAAEAGIHTVLFGEYPWNRLESLPHNMTRCVDWLAVGKYFDGLAS